jgi:hypothetical protein
VGWVFFRATTFTTAATILRRMAFPHSGQGAPLNGISFWCLLGVLALGHALGASGVWKRWGVRLPAPVMGLGYALLLSLTLVLAPDTGKAFIYFKF